jgi:hypothetical protein
MDLGKLDEKLFSLRDIFTTIRDAFTAHLSSKNIRVKCYDDDKEVTKELPMNIFIASNIAHHLVAQGSKAKDVRRAMKAVGYEKQDYLNCDAFSTSGGWTNRSRNKRKTRRISKKRM